MTRLMHRNLRTVPPVVASASGMEIVDTDGKRYLDASGGAAVSCLGHAHPDVLAAIDAQVRRVAYAHSSFFTTDVAEALADTLVATAPPGLEHVYLVSGGSEAIEAALKLARQHAVEIGEPQRSVFIARRQSYHGNTLGALAVGGNEWRRREFEPLLMHVERVSPCFEYRERRGGESQDAYTDRLIAELESTIERVGPERVIGFCAETVVGATAGAVPPTPGYFRRVRDVLDRCGIAADPGRSDVRHGSHGDDVRDRAGRRRSRHRHDRQGTRRRLPADRRAARERARRRADSRRQRRVPARAHVHRPRDGCAAALAVQRVIARDGLLAAVRNRGDYLERALAARFGSHPHVGDIRGRGLFRALDLVADRTTKAPFDPALRLHARVKAEAMRAGLCVYPMGGTIDGVRGDHVLLAPPYIVRETELDEIVARLAQAIDIAVSTAVRDGGAESLSPPGTEDES